MGRLEKLMDRARELKNKGKAYDAINEALVEIAFGGDPKQNWDACEKIIKALEVDNGTVCLES